MDCHEIEALDLAEKYVLRQLGAAEQQSYEEHYFQCPKCFEHLQLLQSIETELDGMQPAASRETAPRWRINWLVWGAATAGLLVVAGVVWWSRFHATPAPAVTTHVAPPSTSGPSLDLLARVEPPGYTAPTLRGAPAETARFRDGMAQYRLGNYEAAIAALTEAATADPKSADVQFFLGICYLLTGNTDQAIARLRATINLGDSLDLEMAHFYLAKAFLRDNDVPRAEAELERAIAMHGDLEQQSRTLLDQIRSFLATNKHE